MSANMPVSGEFTFTEENLWTPPQESVHELANSLESPADVLAFFRDVVQYSHVTSAKYSTAETTNEDGRIGNCYGIASSVGAYLAALPQAKSAIQLKPCLVGFKSVPHANNILAVTEDEFWLLDIGTNKATVLNESPQSPLSKWFAGNNAVLHSWKGRKLGNPDYGLQYHESNIPAEAPPALGAYSPQRMFLKGPVGRIAIAAEGLLKENRYRLKFHDEPKFERETIEPILKPLMPVFSKLLTDFAKQR